MSAQWKPGDVVAWRVDSESYNDREAMVALMDELIAWWPERPRHVVGVAAGTSALIFLKKVLLGAQVGPLVVIDPEDREAVERLLADYDDFLGARSTQPFPTRANGLQAALREFANPTPPKPEEPLGLGAVVEDEDGCHWVKFTAKTGDWWRNHIGRNSRYADISAVRVLSPGCTEDGVR